MKRTTGQDRTQTRHWRPATLAVRGGTARVLRDGAEVFKGAIATLKRFTDDVKEVAEGYECGLSLEKFDDYREGDQIEFYHKVKVS